MVLEARREGVLENTFPEDQTFTQTAWANMLGIHQTTFSDASRISGAERRPDVINGIPVLLTPVSDFPKIVKKIGSRKTRSDRNNWAQGKDTTDNFTVIPPSGIIFTYTHPKQQGKLQHLIYRLQNLFRLHQNHV